MSTRHMLTKCYGLNGVMSNSGDKQWSDCDSKRRYSSPQEAEKNAKAMRRKRDAKLRVYRCRFCKGWHLTKKLDHYK